MKTYRFALASLFFWLLLPSVLLAYADRHYLVDPWENAPEQILFVPLAPVIAIICGHLAIWNSRHDSREWPRRLFAIGGLFLGYAGLLAVVTYPILNQRHPHFEATAVGSLRTLNVATRGFADVNGHFPSDLSELACERDNHRHDWCIDSVLASGMKGAYRITYTRRKVSGDGQIDGYEIHADPTKPTPFTRIHFFTDETGFIRYEINKPAGLNSEGLG